ncbi:hypothetical protein RBU49_04390 [Clostridium sp. MB40-C1]|uniref:tetratricopeptide repeat protein n=1 Tax=Clostridium sp. MB40-C1 TaxID=3070996 RepID=UPI0027DF6D29|nr:hypothetical protein [Clostridium sp. MB40-C1]WMJ81498.1 hypothetical protein RBU49_04390 [Clostridium sp. MB40-C1]
MKKFITVFKFALIGLSLLLLSACATGEQKIFNQALELQKNEKYEDAIKMYSDIIDKYPESKFVANSNVKLNQCIDLIIKKGDDMVSKKDYFQAVAYYENAFKFRTNDTALKDKIDKTKKMVTGKKEEPKTSEGTQDTEEKEYKIAIDALNKYKGKKIHDFSNTSKILEMMIDWESAWESQDINIYKSYYDTNFIGISGGKTMNYNKWIQYKNDLFNRYTSINIDTQLIDATLQGSKLKVKFEQWFNGAGSNPYSDHTYKELIFKYLPNKGWMIISEKPY